MPLIILIFTLSIAYFCYSEGIHLWSIIIGLGVGTLMTLIIATILPEIVPCECETEFEPSEVILLAPIVGDRYHIISDGSIYYIDFNNPDRALQHDKLSYFEKISIGSPRIEKFSMVPINPFIRWWTGGAIYSKSYIYLPDLSTAP